MWLSVVFPLLGGLAAATRYYVDRRAGALASQLQMAAVERVKQDATSARHDAAKLKTDLGVVEQRRAQEEAALRQSLLTAEKEVASLKQAAAPWELTKEQRALLIARLTGAAKGRIAIEYIRSDEARSQRFATTLRDILKNVGYDVWGYMPGFMQTGAPPLVGIRISIKDQKSSVVGRDIQQAFKAIGIEAEEMRRSDQTYEDDFVVVYVGIKP